MTGVVAVLATPAMRAYAIPASVIRIRPDAIVVSNPCNVFPTGSTYAWSYVSGDADIGISDPTSRTVTFLAALEVGQTVNAVWKCVVGVYGEAVVNVQLIRT